MELFSAVCTEKITEEFHAAALFRTQGAEEFHAAFVYVPFVRAFAGVSHAHLLEGVGECIQIVINDEHSQSRNIYSHS